MTDIGIIAIDVVFTLAIIAATSCLAYLVYLSVREHRQLQVGARATADPVAGSGDGVRAARRRTLTSLRPSVVRHHVAS